jgi:hypothetical protein
MMPSSQSVVVLWLDRYRSDVSASSVGLRLQAAKSAAHGCRHLGALFSQNWLFPKLGSDRRFIHWQNRHIWYHLCHARLCACTG